MKRLLLSILLASSALAFAEGEVRLIEGTSINIGCPDCALQEVRIAIDHLKTCPESLLNSNPNNPELPRCLGGEASVVYSVNGGDWQKQPADFIQQGDDGYDYWEFFEVTDKPDTSIQYAIQYEIAGNEYWDNNQYQDYSGVYNVGSSLTIDEVQLVYAGRYEGGSVATLTVAVENIAYHKKVKIIYSNDGGLSWHVSDGSYLRPANNGFEVWSLALRDLTPEEDLIFAINYEVNGQSFWDNNDYQDYRLSTNEALFGH